MPPLRKRRRVGGMLAALGLLYGAVFAQTTPPSAGPPPLVVERAGFLRQTLADSQLLTEQYERALAKLEGELAAATEYEEARLVQQRRTELKALYAGESTLAQSLAMPLLPSQARFSGSAETRGDMLTGWRTGGSAAEWANLRVSPGRYNLELEANMVDVPAILGSFAPGKSQPQERAAFDFYEVSLLAGAEENRRTFEIPANTNESAFTPLRIGPVNFTRSPVTLRLSAAAGYPGNVVRLRNLRLVPVTDDVIPTATSVPASAASLGDMREKLSDALVAAQKPAMTAYLEQLRGLAAANPELADEVNVETKRLLKMMENGRNDTGALLRLVASRAGVAGFEDLDGARLVEDPKNAGDRFVVEHDGKRLTVRLMWILAAPLDDREGARKTFARHFGIEEDDTAGLARAAQEFTTGYLEGKSLRLLIRPGKEKDGTVAALLFLPDIGLYQNVLVDQGLAAVQPPSRNLRLPAMERALLGFLAEREQTAKRQKTGAWALTAEDRR
ncbi:MAG: hypothetical protein U0984_03565 [Prosthecobacter sp.]|nr:hypothetical protein [Prosthecobacter sp.]